MTWRFGATIALNWYVARCCCLGQSRGPKKNLHITTSLHLGAERDSLCKFCDWTRWHPEPFDGSTSLYVWKLNERSRPNRISVRKLRRWYLQGTTHHGALHASHNAPGAPEFNTDRSLWSYSCQKTWHQSFDVSVSTSSFRSRDCLQAKEGSVRPSTVRI